MKAIGVGSWKKGVRGKRERSWDDRCGGTFSYMCFLVFPSISTKYTRRLFLRLIRSVSISHSFTPLAHSRIRYIDTPLAAPVLSNPVFRKEVTDRTPMKRCVRV